MTDITKTLQEWFGSPEKEGLFAKLFPYYEYRKQQLEMALAIADAIEKKEHIIVEAGTGVGKTLAYLTPIFASGKRAVISTATKTLQHQLVRKDIPFLLEKVAPNHFKDKNSVCLLKGRLNYLCKRRLGRLEQEIMRGQLAQVFGNYDGLGEFIKIFRRWLRKTSTGELSELSIELASQAKLSATYKKPNWEEMLGYVLGASPEQCPGPRCAFFGSCFVMNARKKASSAKLIVVNHYLLCTDLAGKAFQAFEVIPSADVLIIDEAHHLPDVITRAFTVSYHSSYLAKLAEELGFATGRKGEVWKEYTKIEQKIIDYHDILLGIINQAYVSKSGDLSTVSPGEMRANLQKVLRDSSEMSKFMDIVKAIADGYHSIRLILDETKEDHLTSITMADGCQSVLSQLADNQSPDSFIWFEMNDHGFSLYLTPLNASTSVSESLFGSYSSVIFTSATIAVANSGGGSNFDYFKTHVGLDPSTKTLTIGSPYSYEDQMMCFIPPIHFPMPDDPGFIDAVLQYTVPIVKSFPGGTLFLCTSYRNMKLIADGLRKELPDRLILVQGEGSRSHVLEEFRVKTGSILIATGTFWEGIDVPGESLQVLLIDKLPFPSPSDPLVEGRSQYITMSGGDPFMDYYVPKMILGLRQGIGRLIRSSRDCGVVGIFDIRIRTKGYGRWVFANLPSCKVVENFEELFKFMVV
ncbi:MAG: ATP-dependent DNA helicase [Thermodesulforhabdaceae bacterium]